VVHGPRTAAEMPTPPQKAAQQVEAANSIRQPQVGDRVVTLDRAPVGQVAAVCSDAFTVNGPHGQCVYALDAVYTRQFGRVTLVCNQSRLTRYAVQQTPFSAPPGQGK
jgi:hypothetical protein